ncbi:MAG: PDZ domain-containing protein [Deltaproteobacteria bacterium]|nr:PDZ domain-containing protein [Deltaproteobacteria bacterium]
MRHTFNLLALAGVLAFTLSSVANADPPAASASAADPIATAQQLGDAFSRVAESISPSVVSIHVEIERASMPRREMPSPFGRGQPRGGVVRGGGSGVIFTADGDILTNRHVVGDARRIEVLLRDGRTLPARLVGADEATDLAVIHVDATGLVPASFASSEDARVGQWVVAVGSPFGLDYTVTAGVLSAKGRGGLGANEIEDYLQTDASINPGNSGGPLVDLEGRVLGINTMIIGRGTGIGFAVPSDIAAHVADQLRQHGVVRRAWLGVGFQEVTPELASSFGVAAHGGALVNTVEPNSPAARAGLRPGDVVVRVGSRAVTDGRDLFAEVLRHDVGDTLAVGIRRRGRAQTLSVTTSERPGTEQQVRRQAPVPPQVPHERSAFGLRMDPLTPMVRRQMSYDGPGTMYLSGVDSSSAAERAGLRPGDVLIEADRRPVRNKADFTRAARDGRVVLYVGRQERRFYTVLTRTRGAR